MAIPLPRLSDAVARCVIPRPPAEIPTSEDIASADILHDSVLNSYKCLDATDEDLANVIIYKSKLITTAGGIAPHLLGPFIRDAIGPAIRDAIKPVLEALRPIRNDIRDMKRDIQTLKDDAQILKNDVQILKDDVQTLKNDNNVIKRDIQTLKNDNNVIKRDIQILKDDNTVIKRDIQTLKNDNANIKEDVGELKINLVMTRRLAAISHNARLGSTPPDGYEIVLFPNGGDPTGEPHNLPPLTSLDVILNLEDVTLDAYMRNYYPTNRGAVRDRNRRLNKVALAIGVTSLPSHIQ